MGLKKHAGKICEAGRGTRYRNRHGNADSSSERNGERMTIGHRVANDFFPDRSRAVLDGESGARSIRAARNIRKVNRLRGGRSFGGDSATPADCSRLIES